MAPPAMLEKQGLSISVPNQGDEIIQVISGKLGRYVLGRMMHFGPVQKFGLNALSSKVSPGAQQKNTRILAMLEPPPPPRGALWKGFWGVLRII